MQLLVWYIIGLFFSMFLIAWFFKQKSGLTLTLGILGCVIVSVTVVVQTITGWVVLNTPSKNHVIIAYQGNTVTRVCSHSCVLDVHDSIVEYPSSEVLNTVVKVNKDDSGIRVVEVNAIVNWVLDEPEQVFNTFHTNTETLEDSVTFDINKRLSDSVETVQKILPDNNKIESWGNPEVYHSIEKIFNNTLSGIEGVKVNKITITNIMFIEY